MTMRCVIAVAGAVFGLSAPLAAAAGPLTADKLPPSLLADCDAQAEDYGRYAPPIADAARALIDIGVFTPSAFNGARIGFCGLQRAGGPVAAAACDEGVILLDTKYAADDQALPLRTTLAHELTHHLQHREAKALHGAGYCASARYAKEKPALEQKADAFGDMVGELFLLGRGVEIVNACDKPLLVYLEADDPVAVSGEKPAFQRIPARSAAMGSERALSRRFHYFAQTAPAAGAPRAPAQGQGAQARIVEGRAIRLKQTLLLAPDQDGGPFRLRLSCAGGRR